MPLATLPLLPGVRAIPRPQSPAYQGNPTEEKDLLAQIGGGLMSGLGMVGSGLDLFPSMVRDTLAGQNPFDQLLSPLSMENRASGRNILEKLGMQRNKPTGIKGWLDDPMEGLRDIAGFGTEVLLDPLTYLTFGGASLGRAGQAVKRAGLLPVVDRLRKGGIQAGNLTENAKRLTQAGGFLGPRRARQQLTVEDVIRAANDPQAVENLETAARAMGSSLEELSGQPLGHHFGLAAPFADPFLTFNAGPIGRGLSSAFDVTGDLLKKSAPVRALRMALDPRVGGQYDRVGQEIAERAYDAKQGARAEARGTNLDATDQFGNLLKTFDTELGDALRQSPDEFHPHDLEIAVQQVMPDFVGRYQGGEALRAFRRENPGWTTLARGTGDYTTVPRSDEIFSEWFHQPGEFGPDDPGGFFPGAFGSLDDLWQALRDPAMARPTGSSPEVLEAARNLLRQNPPGQLAFNQGEVVRAGDRGNFGYVVQPGLERSSVFFRNPETGAVVTRNLPNGELSRAFDNAEQAAEASAKAGQDYSRSVASDLLRATTELGSAEQAFREVAPQLQATPELLRQFDEASATLGAQRDEVFSQIEALGGNARWLNDAIEEGDSFQVGHFPRYIDPKTAKEVQKGRVLPSKFASMKARTLETKNLPSHIRDRILTDNAYRGENAAQNILRDFEQYLDNNWGRDPEAFDFGDFADEAAESAGKPAHAQALADWAQGKPRMRLTGDALKDHAQYIEKASVVKNTLGAIHEVLYRYARPDIEGVPLAQALRKAGLKENEALESFARQFTNGDVAKARQLKVPDEMAKGATSVIEYFGKGPIWQGKIADAVDKFNEWFKTAVTIPFPGFVSRNFLSGQHLNAATAFKSPTDIPLYFGEMKSAKSIMDRARGAFQAGKELESADRQLLKELYQYGVVDPKLMFEGVESAGRSVANPLEALVPENVLTKRHAGTAREFVANNPISLDPFDIAARRGVDDMGRPQPFALDDIPGFSKARRGYRTWIEGGTALNKQVEWMNRVPLYLFFKKKGFSPAQAAKEVIARQFDYGDLSDFSRSVMKRVFPFWSFSSKIAPLVTKELLERPGGGLGQTIRATNLGAGGEGEALPQYVRETTSIPLGEAEDGTLRFLTGLGLAHEDPLSFMAGSLSPGNALRSAGLEAISRSNPLFKAPLEWMTGESFFQRGPMGGRDLNDMDPLVGRLLTNLGIREEDPVSGQAKDFMGPLAEQVLANSPATRFLSTARQLTDDRKWQNPTLFPGDALFTNLFTGLKTTDISPAAQDAVLRDMVAPTVMDELGGRVYENRYIPKATIEATKKRGEEELAERMEAFNRLNRLLGQRAKDRKEERDKKG